MDASSMGQQHLRNYHNGLPYHKYIDVFVFVDTIDDVSMDESYVTYVDDEHNANIFDPFFDSGGAGTRAGTALDRSGMLKYPQGLIFSSGA